MCNHPLGLSYRSQIIDTVPFMYERDIVEKLVFDLIRDTQTECVEAARERGIEGHADMCLASNPRFR